MKVNDCAERGIFLKKKLYSSITKDEEKTNIFSVWVIYTENDIPSLHNSMR